MPFTAYYLSPDGDLRHDLNEQEVSAAFESGEGLLWVDISETTEDDGRFLDRVFHFHHLAVEDALSPRIHPPKIDDFGDHLFIVVHGINYAIEPEIVTAELEIFLGSHLVVSNHNFHLSSIDTLRRLVGNNNLIMKRGASFFAYTLIDMLIDDILPTIDKMSETIDRIEQESIYHPQRSTLDAILRLKHSTLSIHRVIAPEREVLNRISRGEFPMIEDEAQIYYRDVYDHLLMIEELNQIIRDRVDSAQATYLSSVANKQSETMKILAMLATIFMPLTLIAGIYGMNFENMPELRWSWAYFAILGLMVTAVTVAIWRVWVWKWLKRG